MSIKRLIKKAVPKRVKEYIKGYIACETAPTSPAEYVVRISDVDALKGKAVIVTGSTGAIGSAVAHRLYIEGAIVGICGRNKNKVDQIIERFKRENVQKAGQLIPLYFDVTDDAGIEKAIDDFVKHVGRIDAFVNNAGGGARNKSKVLWEQDIETIDGVINTNLRGSILCARKAAQIMVRQNNGVIINMASVVGINGKEKMTDYSAAKAGIIGFTKSLALELGEYNVRVNCVSPGMVNQKPFDMGTPIQNTNKDCLRRFGYTDEVADLIAFIVSDNAKFITGHNFVIDGGRSLGLMGD